MTEKKRLPWRCKNAQQAKDKQAIYNSREWHELRALKLHVTPTCERCRQLGIKAGVPNGWIRAACCVHHIVPIETATTREEMRRLAICGLDGLMSLCKECHAAIHKENRSHTKEAIKEREQQRHERRRNHLIQRFTQTEGQPEGEQPPT